MRVRKAPEIRLGAIFSVHKAVNQIMVAVVHGLTGLDIARDERQRQTFWEATVGQLQPALVGTNKPRSRKQIRRLLSPIVVGRILMILVQVQLTKISILAMLSAIPLDFVWP